MSNYKFNGIGTNLSNLATLSDAKTRSISPENFDGAKGKAGMATEGTGAGCARDLGQGWKLSPSVRIEPHTTYTMAEIDGSGVINHIWLTPAGAPGRYVIIRMYWDGSDVPAVECPLGDFFANAYVPAFKQMSSLAVCVNPRNGLNCYWTMPFKKSCRITVENLADDVFTLYYQVDYQLTEVPEDCGYFHAQFRRSNPVPYKEVHTILGVIVVSLIITIAINMKSTMLQTRAGYRACANKRIEIAEHLRYLPMGWFNDNSQWRTWQTSQLVW